MLEMERVVWTVFNRRLRSRFIGARLGAPRMPAKWNYAFSGGVERRGGLGNSWKSRGSLPSHTLSQFNPMRLDVQLSYILFHIPK
jgi:hypothetical protein